MSKKDMVCHQMPKEIVKEMDKYIIGQYEAKKAVAIAFVSRGRRMLVDDEVLRSEMLPKNVLLSGPTGVGKTEIARRVADITDSPFLKVEMTKFTEVGYAGKDVESIIRDFVDLTIKRERGKMIKNYEVSAKKMAIKYVIQAIKKATKMKKAVDDRNILQTIVTNDEKSKNKNISDSETFTEFEKKQSDNLFDSLNFDIDEDKFANGEYDDVDITIVMPDGVGSKKDSFIGLEDGFINGTSGAVAMISIIPLFSFNKGDKNVSEVARTMKVREALDIMTDYYIDKYLDKCLVVTDVIKKIEQKGVIFLDEIDKLISNKENKSRGDVSREGVQRDLLPIVEGTLVQTKYGSVRTDHILFIAAGAFYYNKISDLMPELQGRFPVSVELKSLTVKDFEHILTDLRYGLIEQQQKLLEVDGIDIKFKQDGIKAIAEISNRLNSELENIGARRLFSVIEKVVEEVSFSGKKGTKLIVDRKYVEKVTSDGFDKKIDARKYII